MPQKPWFQRTTRQRVCYVYRSGAGMVGNSGIGDSLQGCGEPVQVSKWKVASGHLKPKTHSDFLHKSRSGNKLSVVNNSRGYRPRAV